MGHPRIRATGWAVATFAAALAGCGEHTVDSKMSKPTAKRSASRVRPGQVQLLGALGAGQNTPPLPPPHAATPPAPTAETQRRDAVIERLHAMIRAQSQHERPRPLADLGLSWDVVGATAEAFGLRWALYFRTDAGSWTLDPSAARRGWCCVVWPIDPAPQPRTWFANHEGGIWEAPAPPAVFTEDWLPDPATIGPQPRQPSSYLRRRSGAGFVWAELRP